MYDKCNLWLGETQLTAAPHFINYSGTDRVAILQRDNNEIRYNSIATGEECLIKKFVTKKPVERCEVFDRQICDTEYVLVRQVQIMSRFIFCFTTVLVVHNTYVFTSIIFPLWIYDGPKYFCICQPLISCSVTNYVHWCWRQRCKSFIFDNHDSPHISSFVYLMSRRLTRENCTVQREFCETFHRTQKVSSATVFCQMEYEVECHDNENLERQRKGELYTSAVLSMQRIFFSFH
jgi:hypothetical protein